jgi:hypothetical protein
LMVGAGEDPPSSPSGSASAFPRGYRPGRWGCSTRRLGHPLRTGARSQSRSCVCATSTSAAARRAGWGEGSSKPDVIRRRTREAEAPPAKQPRAKAAQTAKKPARSSKAKPEAEPERATPESASEQPTDPVAMAE